MLYRISDSSDVEQLINDSADFLCIIYKHSTRCPISYRAYLEIQAVFNESLSNAVKVFMIDVIVHRSISDELAHVFKVKHESPQLLFVHKAEAKLHYSHSAIRKEKVLADISSQIELMT